MNMALTPEQIKFFRENPDMASDILLETPLVWFQRIILRTAWEKPFTIVVASRGIGKTWLGAIYLLLHCILYNDVKCGVYGKEYGFTKETFEKIIEIYDKSPFLREVTLIKPHISKEESYIELVNHSYIIAEVAKRSKRKNIVLCDEAREMDIIGMYDRVIFPFLNAKHPVLQNKSLMVSSATYEGTQFHERVKLYQKYIKEGSKNHAVVMFDVNAALTGPWMDKVVLEEAKKTMLDEEYRIEYLNEFVSLASGWINGLLIRGAELDYKPEKAFDGQSFYFIAYDPAIVLGGDNATIVVCKIVPNEGVRVVRCIAMNGVKLEDQAMVIRQCVKDYVNVQEIILDGEKLGIVMKQYLAKPSIDTRDQKPLPAIVGKEEYDLEGLKLLNPINFRDTNLITNMAFITRAALQNGTLHLPKDTHKMHISHEEKKVLSQEDLEIIEMAQEITELKKEISCLKCVTNDTGSSIKIVAGNSQTKRDRYTSFFMCAYAALKFYEELNTSTDDFVGSWGEVMDTSSLLYNPFLIR